MYVCMYMCERACVFVLCYNLCVVCFFFLRPHHKQFASKGVLYRIMFTMLLICMYMFHFMVK